MFFVCTFILSLTLLIHVNAMTAINPSRLMSPVTWHMIPVIGHQRRLITVILSKLTCDFRNLPPEHNIYPNILVQRMLLSSQTWWISWMFALFAVEKYCKTHILFFANAAKEKKHRNGITLSHNEFLLTQNCTTLFWKLCNDIIFPFNKTEYYYEFTITLDQFISLLQRAESQHPDSMILDPLEIKWRPHSWI